MSEVILDICLLLAAVGISVIGGVFFAFSSFVMKGLGHLPTEIGLQGMQRINIDVLNWHFLGLFFVSGALATISAILALALWPITHSVCVVTGAALYIGGTVFVTGVYNVPLNNRLATVDPQSADADTIWRMYLQRWTRWNHVRTAAAVSSTVFLLIPLISFF